MRSKQGLQRVFAGILGTAMVFSLAIPGVHAQGDNGGCSLEKLRTNYLSDPLGIDDRNPDFSWVITSEVRSQYQTAYQVQVATDANFEAIMWDSGKVESDQSNNVEYPKDDLQEKNKYYWRVRVWDKEGNPSTWSETAGFETAMFPGTQWEADWISSPSSVGGLVPVEYEFSQPVTTRYVNLNVTKLGDPPAEQGWRRLQLAEIEVYGSDDETVNLAAGCRVTADNPISDVAGWGAENLTDGIRESVAGSWGFSTNAYVNTDIPDPALNVTIDLGSEQTVSKVVLYPRTDVPSEANPALTGNFPKDFTIQTKAEGEAEFTTQVQVEGQQAPQMPNSPDNNLLPVLGKSFVLDGEIQSARAYVSGLGYYEMTINGQPVTDYVLEPGESAYDKTVLYTTYDITDLLQEGENAAGAMLGKGLYSVTGGTGRYQKLNTYYGPLQFLAQIEVTYQDGTVETIVTDESWKTTSGPITFSDWYGGEDYDATREMPGWNEPGYGYEGWDNAVLTDYNLGELTAKFYPDTKVMDQWTAVSVNKIEKDGQAPVYVIDFGQNFAGVYEMSMSAPKGTQIQFWPSELLNPDGTVDQADTGTPIYDCYTFKGEGTETWSPKFVYHGFRYLEVRGLPEGIEPTADMFQAKLIRAENEKIGTFETSSDVLNQIDVIINRSVEANMYNTLTDCPHREKLGWLEVPQLMYNSIAPNYDVSAWMTKISHDTIDSQTAEGLVPDIAPEYTVFGGGFRDDPTWGGACILVPYYTYTTYGNIAPLKESFETMNRYMDYLAGKSNGYLLNHGLGDWGGYDTSTSVGFTVSCTYYELAKAMHVICELLGETTQAEEYLQLAGNIKDALNQTYYHQEGYYDSGSQGANAMALYYGICEEENQGAVLDSLVQGVREAGDHLTTGEISLKPLFLGLGQNGRNDVVYAMATNKTMPSYWYFIENGATSLPEFWDMQASQLHCMMGHLESWFYEELAGIRNTGIAYKTLEIDPYFPEDLSYIDVSTQTVYGTVASAWSRNTDGTVNVEVEIPVNTTAVVYLPTSNLASVTESGVALTEGVDGVASYAVETGKIRIELGSGRYVFTCEAPLDYTQLEQCIEAAHSVNESNVASGWEELQTAVAQAQALKEQDYVTQADIDAAVENIQTALDQIVLINLALDRTPIVSSSYDANQWNRLNLTDGDRVHATDVSAGGNGGWSSSNFDGSQDPQWCGVDFGQAEMFDRVILYPRSFEQFGSDVSKSFASSFSFQISDDGENWTTVAEYSDYARPKNGVPQVFDIGTQEAQYVRFYADGLDPENGYLLQIAEMEVYKMKGDEPQEPTVDKSLLQKTYDYAKAQDTSNLVSSAKEKFEAVIAKAKAVLEDETATQEQVNATWSELVDVIHALGLVKGDKDMLELVITQAESMVAEADKYVETNWQQLVDALAAAQTVMDDADAMQGEVDEATSALLDAILAQRYKADKSILDDLIGKAESMDVSGCSAQSVAVFRAALAEAQAVMADNSLTEDNQDTVDAAVEKLSAAMETLVAEGAPEPSQEPEVTDQPEATNHPETTQKPGQGNVPQTGDGATIALWLGLLAGGTMGISTLNAVRTRRKKR